MNVSLNLGDTGLPCAEKDVPACLVGLSSYVESVQAKKRELEAEVERLRGEVDRLARALSQAQQQLEQSKVERVQQGEQVRCLTDQLAEAGKAFEAAAAAHEEERRAARAEARQLADSRDDYARRLAQAERYGRQGGEEARQAAGCLRQLQQDLAAAQQELERERREKESALQGSISVQELKQQLAALQQELEAEREQKEVALKAKSSYKYRAVELSNQYRIIKNSYKRLRKEKGVEAGGPCSSFQGTSRQLEGTDTPPAEPADLGNDGMEGQGIDSEEQGLQATAPLLRPQSRSGMPQAASQSATDDLRQAPLLQAEGPMGSKPHVAAEQPAQAGREPAGMQVAALQAGQSPDRQCKAQPAGNAQLSPSPVSPDSDGISSCELLGALSTLPLPCQQAGGSAGSGQEPAAVPEPNPSAPHPTQHCTTDSGEPVGMQHDTQRGHQQRQEQQRGQLQECTSAPASEVPAECPAPACPADAEAEEKPFAGEPALPVEEHMPALLQPMPPPPPRLRRSVAAAAAGGASAGVALGPLQDSSPPWQQRPQEWQGQRRHQQQQRQHQQEPCEMALMECETQVTQPDIMHNLLQLAVSPPPQQRPQQLPLQMPRPRQLQQQQPEQQQQQQQQRKGVKRQVLQQPQPPVQPPSEAPAIQSIFDRGQAPVWGPSVAMAAREPLPAGGPAWKKAARPNNVEVLAFDAMGAYPRQQQQPALQQGIKLPSAVAGQALPPLQQQQQQQQAWQGRAEGGSTAAGERGGSSNGGDAKENGVGYKYQDVVRKRDERAKLKGVECLQCQRFYEALETWGTIAPGGLPGCGHVSGQDLGGVVGGRPGAAAGLGAGPGLLSRDELREAGSRHRYRYEPPATPQDYWNMDFTPATSQA